MNADLTRSEKGPKRTGAGRVGAQPRSRSLQSAGLALPDELHRLHS